VNGRKVLRYSNTTMERQEGEVARIRILKGPDQGSVFIIRDSNVLLGRGDHADLRVADIKTSRIHTRLQYTHEGWMMVDQGSANGINYHGEYIRQLKLRSGDHFILGETIFEFLTSDQDTRILTAPMKKAAEIEQMDRALAEQREMVKSIAKGPKIAQAGGAGNRFNPRTLVLILLLGGGYYYTEMMDAPAPAVKSAKNKKKKGEEDSARNVASQVTEIVDLEVAKTAEQFYRQGFREFREKNYMRAQAQFELALQVNPNHWLARHYLLLAENEIGKEIDKMIKAAQKAKAAGRLRESKGYLEAAMRLMYNDQSNPDYIECEEEVKKINREIERTPIR
jgi:pSer/pThr/pTyr-binding forkhead associated (FHA) protein